MAGRETSGGSLSTLDPGWSRCGVAYLDTRRRRQTDEEGYWDRPTPVSPSGPPESLAQPFEGWAIRRTAVSPTGTRKSNLGVARARRPNGRYWRPHFKDSSRKRNRAFLLRQHDHGDCSATALEDARAVCVDRGVRLTPTRQRVLEIIWQGRRPLGAYEILEVLSGEGYCPSPPTVYRALEFLVSHGLVHRLPSLNAFVGCSRPGHSGAAQFLLCTACGMAAEINDSGIESAIERGAVAEGFDCRDQAVEISGLCPHCRADQ